MNSGILQFTLGLGTGGFLGALGGAGNAAKAFTGGLVGGLAALTAGIAKAIARGAEFEHLHKRTGQSVADLYTLSQGFKAAGLSGDETGQTIFFMQKALGGVNEEGQNTADIFHQIGLNIGDLKKLNAPQQITAILAAMSKLKPEDAAKAASGIFGRMSAGNMLQVMRSPEEFAQGMKDAAREAAQLGRTAAAFEQIGRSTARIKEGVLNMFAGLAEGAAPSIQAVQDMINSIDFAGIGQKAGRIFSGMAEAFKEGKIQELLELTFAAATEFFVNAISNTLGSSSYWKGIFQVVTGEFITGFAVILKMVASIGTVLIAAFDTAYQKYYEEIGKIPGLGKALGISGFKASSFEDNFKNRQKEGAAGQAVLSDITKYGAGLMAEGVKGQVSAFAGALAKSGGPAQDALKNFVSGLEKSVAPLKQSSVIKTGSGASLARESYTYKPEFSAFEKMGFVMRGGVTNPATEYARQTRDNTQKLVSLAEATVQLLGGATNEPTHAPI